MKIVNGDRNLTTNKILITGDTGFIGSHVAKRFASSPEWSVLAGHDLGGRSFDLATPGETAHFIDRHQPNVVVHTAAISSIAACDENRTLARRVNTDAVSEIADACLLIGSRLIHLSTDQVFDGNKAPYTESSATSPLHYYGETKVSTEEALGQHDVESVLLRPTLVYGNDPAHGRSASESIRNAAQKGQTLGLFSDEFRAPVYVGDLVDCIQRFAAMSVTGLFHVGGPSRLSRWDFGHVVCLALGLNQKAIRPSSLEECGLIGKRPRDLTLDTSKLAEVMNWSPKTPQEALASATLG
ncbi:MAG: dTDP-4-dehydrorhamnose reductase [Planctomycetota bacterium]|jgi:dTDP-4-dehydrorhamnose reductase